MPLAAGRSVHSVTVQWYESLATAARVWALSRRVVLSGSGTTCSPPLAPTAGFASDSPVMLGGTLSFADQTVGATPLTYQWDFGDGEGTSTDSHPTYRYQSAGTFTVTLTVTNSLGTDSISHPVLVEAPASLHYLPLLQKTG